MNLKFFIMFAILISFVTSAQEVVEADQKKEYIYFTQNEDGSPKDQLQFLYNNILERTLDIPLGAWQNMKKFFGTNPAKKLYRNKKEVKEVLSILKPYLTPLEKNDLSFFNTKEEWLEYAPRVIGYCRGLAHLGISFNRLGIFEYELSKSQVDQLKKTKQFNYLNNVPLRGDFQTEDAYRKAFSDYHKEIIERMASGKIQVIPGKFRNLKDYASDERIDEAIHWVTADFWGKNTLNLDSGSMMIKMYRDKPKLKFVDQFLNELSQRIELGHNAKIYFSLDPENTPQKKKLIKVGKKKYLSPTVIHVVEAYKIKYMVGQKVRIYVWDRNYPPQLDRDYLEVDLKSGETIYPDWGKKEAYSYAKGLISDFGFTKEDEYMMEKTFSQWKNFKTQYPRIYQDLKTERAE